MREEQIRNMLRDGMSVEAIARSANRDASTIAYWMRKYGLDAPNREKHAAKGELERDVLERLVDDGLSLDKTATAVHRSPSTVRHWLRHHGLETIRARRRRERASQSSSASDRIEAECPTHGVTLFWRDANGSRRCLKCRQDAVTRRRRRVKSILVDEAGGCCAICGYDRYLGALQFHHLVPANKAFSLGTLGLGRSIADARQEAQKCVLLCSNCHAEVEAGRASIPE